MIKKSISNFYITFKRPSRDRMKLLSILMYVFMCVCIVFFDLFIIAAVNPSKKKKNQYMHI